MLKREPATESGVLVRAETQEPTLVFNNKEYPLGSLDKEVIENVQSLRFAELEIQRLRARLALAQTAANAYRNAIVARLPKEETPAAPEV